MINFLVIYFSFLASCEAFEPVAGIEPATSSLPRKCSTSELHRQNLERKTRLKLATLSLEG